jgi:hypothetical protein
VGKTGTRSCMKNKINSTLHDRSNLIKASAGGNRAMGQRLKQGLDVAEKNLSAFPPRHHGLDVAALCQLLRRYADQIVASDYKTNPWSPQTAPRLELGVR